MSKVKSKPKKKSKKKDKEKKKKKTKVKVEKKKKSKSGKKTKGKKKTGTKKKSTKVKSKKKDKNGLPEILTTGIIADFLGISQLAAGNWIDDGHIKGSNLPSTMEGRVGRRRVKRQDFIDFLEEQNVPLDRLKKEVVFTTSQLARAAKVCTRTITLWIDRGLIEHFTIVSKRRLVFEKDALRFFKDNNMNTKLLKKQLEKRNPGLPKRD